MTKRNQLKSFHGALVSQLGHQDKPAYFPTKWLAKGMLVMVRYNLHLVGILSSPIHANYFKVVKLIWLANCVHFSMWKPFFFAHADAHYILKSSNWCDANWLGKKRHQHHHQNKCLTRGLHVCLTCASALLRERERERGRQDELLDVWSLQWKTDNIQWFSDYFHWALESCPESVKKWLRNFS